LAGPLSNILLATILAVFLRIYPSSFLFEISFPVILLNISLAVFNLLPIHPLDGGKIIVGLLPPRAAAQVDLFLKQYGVFLLIILIFPIFGGSSFVLTFLSPIINFLLKIYLPGSLFV